MGDDLGAEPVLREDGGAAVGLGAGGLRRLGHGDLRELLLQRVRDDLVVVDRVDPDLGEGGGVEEGAGAVGLRRRRGVVGGGGLRAVHAGVAVEEVVEAPADDVGVQILVAPHHHGWPQRIDC